jgi:23S rRNA pseudouridine955/2504/2580 synthase
MRMADPSGRPLLRVSREEEGMKLARFLERRLNLPGGMIRKWIRTGQSRINGRRVGPFTPLCAGDAVRLPPFAFSALPAPLPGQEEPPPDPAAALAAAGLRLAACAGDLLVLCKPCGLPTHPGSGHRDSVAGRLARALSAQPFLPAPAHRLDRHTSGLLLAGRTHRAQVRLQRALAQGRGIAKDYLAWVAGRWEEEPCLLADVLRKERERDGREVTRALPGGRILPLRPGVFAPGNPDPEEVPPGQARCLVVRAGLLSSSSSGPASLLLIRLLTGRTHQIRVQTAARGFPVLGDGRHGGPRFPLLLLHAWRLRLAAGLAGEAPWECRALPDWPPPYALAGEEAEEALARLEALLSAEAGPARKQETGQPRIDEERAPDPEADLPGTGGGRRRREPEGRGPGAQRKSC